MHARARTTPWAQARAALLRRSAAPRCGRGARLFCSSTPNSTTAPPTTSDRRSSPLRVCVVGGGVVGLTSALRLLQLQHPSTANVGSETISASRPLEVTVVAAAFGTETTTAGAAGLWGPYKLSDTPEALINRWGSATYEHLMRLAYSRQSDVAGVSVCSVNSFYPAPQPLPFWHPLVHNFQLMDPRMLDSARRAPGAAVGTDALVKQSEPGWGPDGGPEPEPLSIGWGYHWNSVVCEGARYLPWLAAQVEARGGRLTQRPRLGRLGELSGFDVVVNAAGLGSRELVDDENVYPIRGQVVRVRASWVKQAFFFEPFYVIPNRDTVLLGGTGQVGNYSREVCPEDRARILEGCRRLLPSLEGAEVAGDWVGLRPGRTRLRLELERRGAVLADGRVVPVVHNYGHGGAGLTLAWGCAGDVARLLLEEGLL